MNKGIYFAVFTALLWGFLAIALKVALKVVPPVTISWLRFAIAWGSLMVYYTFFNKGKLLIYKSFPYQSLIAGIALGANYLGFIAGIHHTTPSIGQVFIQSGPVIFAICGFVFFKEKVTIRQTIGLGMVLIGMLVFYNEQILNIAGGMSAYKKGVFYTLIGALSWSVYAVFQKIAVKKSDPMQLNLIIFGIPTLFFIPMVDFSALNGLTIYNWLLIIFLGLNTLGAYGALSFAIKYLEANKVSAIVTLNPLITFSMMAWLSKRKVSWIQPETYTLITIVGAVIGLAGVILTVTKAKNIEK